MGAGAFLPAGQARAGGRPICPSAHAPAMSQERTLILDALTPELIAVSAHMPVGCSRLMIDLSLCQADKGGPHEDCRQLSRRLTFCADHWLRKARKHCGAELESTVKCLERNNMDVSKCDAEAAVAGCLAMLPAQHAFDLASY